MMREIKFRAWDGKQMWSYAVPTLGRAYNGGNVNCSMNESGTFNEFKKDPVLMQYTCLKDANGVEIYEGDIVDAVLINDLGIKEKLIGKVAFSDFEYVIETNDRYWPVASWHCLDSCVVIGNDFETPELLK